MPYHDSEAELKKLLKKKNFFNDARWKTMQDEGMSTMEEVAHSLGDLQGPLDNKRLERVLKILEGDWDTQQQLKDADGKPKTKVKLASANKPVPDLKPEDFEPEMGVPGQNNRVCNKWSLIFWHCRTATTQAEVERIEKGDLGTAPKITGRTSHPSGDDGKRLRRSSARHYAKGHVPRHEIGRPLLRFHRKR